MNCKPGDRVRVVFSLLYVGQDGTVIPNSGLPDDPWDWNVILDSGARIGINDHALMPL